MTFTIVQEHLGENYIAIEQEKYSSAYKVIQAHTVDGDLYYTDKENYYPTLAAARRRYSTLKRSLQA